MRSLVLVPNAAKHHAAINRQEPAKQGLVKQK